ncbi:MAG: RNA polymerase sigma-70 factor [Tannerellaceae bacterium]|nr:RNA polymerase sigma-70 factor [Tannerellaceae bacterium]
MEKGMINQRKEKYAKVYAIYFPKLVRFSEAYILSRDEAENLVQDVFLYLWEHPELFDSLKNIRAFIFTMVKNKCVDYLRKQTQDRNQKRPFAEIEENELTLRLYSLQSFDEDILSHTEIDTIIQDAIYALPARCREIFVLSRFDGLKHKEIASLLNISTHTIESQIAIALRRLKAELRNYFSLLF